MLASPACARDIALGVLDRLSRRQRSAEREQRQGTKLNLLNRTLKAAIAPCDTWVSCRRAAPAREMTPRPPSRRSEVEGRIAMTKSVTKSALSLITFGAVLALLQGTPAQALNTKSYVSNTGSDANDCSSVALACAGLQHAHDQTSPGGEVSVVSPGDYSGLNSSVAARLIIQKSIHITNDGVGEASIRTPGLNLGIAILIQPSLGAIVSVRGLVIDGVGVGLIGIDIMTPSAVHIQNCVVRNFQSFRGWGVTLLHGINTQLFISDSIIFNNGSDAFSGGIQIAPVNIPNISGSSDAKVVLDRVHLENNVIGVLVDGQISREGQQGVTKSAYVIIRDSVVSGNGLAMP